MSMKMYLLGPEGDGGADPSCWQAEESACSRMGSVGMATRHEHFLKYVLGKMRKH
jgi:hypothetical protein